MATINYDLLIHNAWEAVTLSLGRNDMQAMIASCMGHTETWKVGTQNAGTHKKCFSNYTDQIPNGHSHCTGQNIWPIDCSQVCWH